MTLPGHGCDSLAAHPDLTGLGAAAPLVSVTGGPAPWSSGRAVGVAGHTDAGRYSLPTLQEASMAEPFQIHKAESATPALPNQPHHPCDRCFGEGQTTPPPVKPTTGAALVQTRASVHPVPYFQQRLVTAALETGCVSICCIHCKNLFRDFLSWSVHPENRN